MIVGEVLGIGAVCDRLDGIGRIERRNRVEGMPQRLPRRDLRHVDEKPPTARTQQGRFDLNPVQVGVLWAKSGSGADRIAAISQLTAAARRVFGRVQLHAERIGRLVMLPSAGYVAEGPDRIQREQWRVRNGENHLGRWRALRIPAIAIDHGQLVTGSTAAASR